MKRDFDNTFTEAFAEGASRAFWAMSWAAGKEERGEPLPRGDLLQHAPPTPLSAWVAAGELIGKLEAANGVPIHTLADRAAKAEGRGDIRDLDAELFGHYLAMEAMGHGVSWFDTYAQFQLKVPHMEYHADSEFS